MHLLECTLELLEQIFMGFIQGRTFKRAMRLRLVSRTFKYHVDEAIFRSRMLDQIVLPHVLRPGNLCFNAAWVTYVQAYLSRRIILETNPALPGFRIRLVAEKICNLDCKTTEETLLGCIRNLCELAFFDGTPRVRALIASTAGTEPSEEQLQQDLIDAAVYLNLFPLVRRLLSERPRYDAASLFEVERLLDKRLVVAALNGNIKIIKLLLASEPSIISSGAPLPNRFLSSILQWGAIGGHHDVFDFGLDHCEIPIQLCPWRSQSNTGIEQALLLTSFPSDYMRATSILKGEDEGNMKLDSWTDRFMRLDNSARQGHTDMVRYFLEQGIGPNNPTSKRDYCGVLDDSAEITKPLLSAIESRDERTVRMMLDYGADPNWFGPEETALMVAVDGDSIGIVRMLVDGGADVNDGSPPPIVLAVRSENMDIFRYLCENGAVLDTPDSGAWAMALATFYGLDSMVEELVQRGVEKQALLHRVPPLEEAYAYRYIFKQSDYSFTTY